MPKTYLNGKIPEDVAIQFRDQFFQDRLDNPDSKRRSVQQTYNGDKITIELDNKKPLGVRFRLSSERTAKTNRRRNNLSKPKLSSIETMMVDNLYEEGAKRGLDVDHKVSAKDKGFHHPSNMGLMQKKENGRKGGRSDYGNFQYEPLIESPTSLKGLRLAAKTAAFAGAALPHAFGIGASAAEVIARDRIAKRTGNTVDNIQSQIAQFGAAADAVSLAPTPVTVVGGAVISTGADVVNGSIDVVRDGLDILKRHGLRL